MASQEALLNSEQIKRLLCGFLGTLNQMSNVDELMKAIDWMAENKPFLRAAYSVIGTAEHSSPTFNKLKEEIALATKK